jgi:hypothetical protein
VTQLVRPKEESHREEKRSVSEPGSGLVTHLIIQGLGGLGSLTSLVRPADLGAGHWRWSRAPPQSTSSPFDLPHPRPGRARIQPFVLRASPQNIQRQRYPPNKHTCRLSAVSHRITAPNTTSLRVSRAEAVTSPPCLGRVRTPRWPRWPDLLVMHADSHPHRVQEKCQPRDDAGDDENRSVFTTIPTFDLRTSRGCC